MQKTLKISVVLAALAVLGGSALAQTPPPAPAHQGFFSKLFHHNRPMTTTPMPGHMMPGRPMPMMRHSMMGGGMTPMSGGVIGNKNTHVYHMPGDHGMLPAANNRVYFHSAAQAEAAGYHHAGGGMMHSSSTKMHHTMMPSMSH